MRIRIRLNTTALSTLLTATFTVLVKAFNTVTACVLCLVNVFLAAEPLLKVCDCSWLYPAYRQLVSFGGTKSGDYHYALAFGTEKIQPTDTLKKRETLTLSMSANEREGFQFTIATKQAAKSVSLAITDFDGASKGISAAIYKEHYLHVVNCGTFFSDVYPDALVPYSGEAVNLTENENLSFYIELITEKDTPAGEYTLTLCASDGEGNAIGTVTVPVQVWDFALPDKPASATAVGLTGSIFPLAANEEYSAYAVNTWLTFYDGSITLTAEQEKCYKQYYDYLLEHGLCANFLPYDLLDERAEAYMDDPRVTTFCIPYPEDDEKLVAYYARVNEKAEWAEKAYFYPVDEPTDSSRIGSYNVIVERLESLCPGYRMVTPFSDSTLKITDTGEEYDSIVAQEKHNKILCPHSGEFDKPGVEDQLHALIDEGGRELWWYVCCGPSAEKGYCNNFIQQPGICPRMLFWQAFGKDVTGFLYYDTAQWGFCGNPWLNSKTHLAEDTCGDGNLLYPGRYINYDGAVGSLRLKAMANGIEDYTLLTMARKLLGEKYVSEIIGSVTKTLTKYTLNDEYFAAVRAKLGEAVEQVACSE